MIKYNMLGKGLIDDIELDYGKHKDLYKTVRYCSESNKGRKTCCGFKG